MLAQDLISDLVPALKTSDSGLDALNWMEVFRVSHLPIVNNKEFLGLITDTDIFDLNKPEEPLGNHQLSLSSPYVYYNQHIYTVIEIASRLQLTVIPVLSARKEYLGMITQTDLLKNYADLIAAHTPGGIIEIEIPAYEYSISKIAQIIEDADTKVLSFYVNQTDEDAPLKITIKLNREDISPVLRAFDRYDYTVIASYSEHNTVDEIVKKNYDALIRYLNV
ncbi:CBS domain-containing protein [Plebeiibacterium marinum]|uniref:CBS domain-containing protein n=1 Tax=Plebeiibacterium marinum TaxID=2992111 RepID=A0AAE3MHH5_9BACT|nr:CBS domain-containing protein [Plebeiobacterium marinum]MCW3807152.1 CBS domain-containing protein [Plebeiobacterium marinum]